MKKAYYIYMSKEEGECPPCKVVEPFVDELIAEGYDIEKIERFAYGEKFDVKTPVTPRIAIDGDIHQVYFRQDNQDHYPHHTKDDIGKRIKLLFDL